MKKAGFFIVLSLVTICIFGVSCGEQYVEFESEYISHVAMTANIDKNYLPENITYKFSSDTDRIYCTFYVVDAPAGTSMTAEWVYIKGSAGVKDYVIDTGTELIEGSKNVALYINRLPNGWPSGSYELFIYINGEIQGSVPFTVE